MTIDFDLSECVNMTPEQKLTVLTDCLTIASSMADQLNYRFDDLFETMFDTIEEA